MRSRIPIDGSSIADLCRRHHVRRLALYGSVLRDDFTPENDVEVLVAFERGRVPGLAFFSLESELTDLLGRKVDLQTRTSSAPPSATRCFARRRPTLSRRDLRVTLAQMRGHTREALLLVKDKERLDLEGERVLTLALARLLEILGEASTRVPVEDRTRLAVIPWKPLIGLRNRLIHAYDRIDLDILWEILTADLPPLLHAHDDLLEPKDP